jgi:glycosyltransferase involved in cell wall biosynthesis
MRILHTESSRGCGGQEIRILKEAEGMRSRGHEVVIAVAKGGGLAERARAKGFTVYEIRFSKLLAFFTLLKLAAIVSRHDIELINTHSSLDAWMGGIAGRFLRKKIVRTKQLYTPIRKGLNSRLLYKGLADFVATTSSSIIPMICIQSKLSPFAIRCIPTGVEPIEVKREEIEAFRRQLGVSAEECLVGTACFVRSWKGIDDFLHAVALLKDNPRLKWVIVGGGHLEKYRAKAEEMGLSSVLTFTGHLDVPYAAIASMDIFALLSTAHEGVSQASLQAAYLRRPLITTNVGGLPEVCIENVTGLQVPVRSPAAFADRVLKLMENPSLREAFGANAERLVLGKFMFSETLDQMESVCKSLLL